MDYREVSRTHFITKLLILWKFSLLNGILILHHKSNFAKCPIYLETMAIECFSKDKNDIFDFPPALVQYICKQGSGQARLFYNENNSVKIK